jgi:hypothetical protein
MSIGYHGGIVALLKVRVEIGTLEVLQIEGWQPGPWLEGLRSLRSAIDGWSRGRLGPVEVTGAGHELPPSEANARDVEALKHRFGLSD